MQGKAVQVNTVCALRHQSVSGFLKVLQIFIQRYRLINSVAGTGPSAGLLSVQAASQHLATRPFPNLTEGARKPELT